MAQEMSMKQEKFIRMKAQGKSRAEILKEIFGLDMETASEREIRNADNRMCDWKKHPEYERVWKSEIRDVLFGFTGEAVQVIGGQLNKTELPWLQNKAANDILNYGKHQIFGNEENEVTVRIEGMPELGTPDSD